MASAARTILERLVAIERPLRWCAECLLIAVLAVVTARLVWLIVSPSDAVATYTDRPLPGRMQSANGSIGLAADRTLLVTTNPFALDEVDVVIQDAPQTSLNLKLDGLRMSTEGGDAGNAIIRTPNGIGKNYGVGDEILPGVTLERILSDRVIINRDGADETLMLGGRGAGLSVISDDSRVTTRRDTEQTTEDQSDIPETPSVVEARIVSPELLFGSMNAGPVAANGMITGYRLDPMGSADIMRQSGLEPGDILLQINGTSVAQLDTRDLIANISSQETAELRVNRNGNVQTIRLRFGE